MSSHTRGEANRAIEGLRAQGGTAMGTWLTLARQIFQTVPHVTKRHAILLTDGVNEGETPQSLAGRGAELHRRLPVRLPRRRRPVAGRGGARHRVGAARHGRPHPGARGDGGRVRGDDARVDGPRRRERRAARVGAAGRRAALRQAGVADPRGPLDPPHARSTRSTGGLPDGRVVRREPRLPRGGAAAGPHAGAGAARGAGADLARRRAGDAGASSRPSGATTRP